MELDLYFFLILLQSLANIAKFLILIFNFGPGFDQVSPIWGPKILFVDITSASS